MINANKVCIKLIKYLECRAQDGSNAGSLLKSRITKVKDDNVKLGPCVGGLESTGHARVKLTHVTS